MGLKTRLIIAFLSIILLPLLVAGGILYVYSSYLDELTEEQEIQLDDLFSEVTKEVAGNFEHIDDAERFFALMSPVLDEHDIDIRILTRDDVILFSSREFRTEYADNHPWFMDVDPFQLEVETNTGHLVDVDILADFDVDPFSQFEHVMKVIIVSIGAGAVVLIALIIGWTWHISRTILHPIKNIYVATEEMREGNLDYEIDYHKKDEIGRFINGFNVMRSQLKQSIKQQQQYEKMRKELIASISHDLRTPLASIKGYVEGLQDGIVQNEEMKKKYLHVIKTKTDQLDRLIDDLFDYSKFELDQLPINKQLMDSRDFFEEVLENAILDMQQRHTDLIMLNAIPSVVVNIDPQRMEQVMMNLLNNAVQYGGDIIEVQITVDTTRHTPNDTPREMLTIRVIDNGQGISKEDLPFIFDQFYRGEKSRSREHGGAGLGLSITKYIILAHDGDIDVHSEEGQGSMFIFSLPTLSNE